MDLKRLSYAEKKSKLTISKKLDFYFLLFSVINKRNGHGKAKDVLKGKNIEVEIYAGRLLYMKYTFTCSYTIIKFIKKISLFLCIISK